VAVYLPGGYGGVKSGDMNGKYKRIIEEWSKDNNDKLWRVWNDIRPTELKISV